MLENNFNLKDFEINLLLNGDYFDSYLYKGKLYLWTMDGILKVIDWNLLFEDEYFTKIGLDKNFLFKIAFRQSDMLYGKRFEELLNDEFFIGYFKENLKKIKRNKEFIEIPKKILEDYKKFEIDMGNYFLHSEAKFYYEDLYISLQNGIYKVPMKKFFKYLPKSPYRKFEKISDISPFSFIISYGDLYASAGSEGLVEINIKDVYNGEITLGKGNERVILEKHSTYVSNLYWNTYSYSLISGDFFIKNKKKTEDKIEKLTDQIEIISSADWLNTKDNPLVISGHNRVYELKDGTIYVYKYNPNKDSLKLIKPIYLGKFPDEIISNQITAFGLIIETNNELLILPSVLSEQNNFGIYAISTSEDGLAGWRSFPKSKFYENQLHLIYEDRLIIKSFLYDYFVPQYEKLLGISIFKRKFDN